VIPVTSKGRQRWLNAGSPIYGIATPIDDLRICLNAYGYTVGTRPDQRHLMADPAEDHTWYSETGWPGAALLGWCYAGDVMPPPAGSGLPSAVELGEQFAADWAGGILPWLKYMNRTLRDRSVIHEARDPNYRRSASSDAGHDHLSCRTDFRLYRPATPYDPVARWRANGGVVPAPRPPESTGVPALARTLRRTSPMMHGADVKQAQDRFKARKWKIVADGWYGDDTRDVVVRYQRDSTAHGWPLSPDGEIGPLTWRSMWLRPVS
jgi:hypothetical protein